MTGERTGARVLLTDRGETSTVGPIGTRLRSWLPPIDRREFWATQALVVLVAALHFLVEYQGVLDDHSPIYLLPTTLFLIPVLYAALSFGRKGAVLTALWAAFLVVPNLMALHDPVEGAGELIQVMWITGVAVFVGGRVEHERSARREAEYREARQRDSEQRYRAIMNNVGEPILVLDADQRVIEANDSAVALFGNGSAGIRGDRLAGGMDWAMGAFPHRTMDEDFLPRLQLGQPPRWYEPVVTRGTDPDGSPTTQILLVDVTASTEREQGLESITRRTITAREEERRRVSRELHDGPLQSLVTLWRDIDAAASDAGGEQRERLLRARSRTEAVADELRRFSRDLRPSVLDDLGIAAALRGETKRVAAESDVGIGIDVVGPPRRLGPETEITLLRITQEALRNVARHSEASQARVTLDFGPPGVRVRVSDDGIGLDPVPTPSELMSGSHLGLIGMRERARMVGGQLLIRRAALGGLEVEVEVPETSLGRHG